MFLTYALRTAMATQSGHGRLHIQTRFDADSLTLDVTVIRAHALRAISSISLPTSYAAVEIRSDEAAQRARYSAIRACTNGNHSMPGRLASIDRPRRDSLSHVRARTAPASVNLRQLPKNHYRTRTIPKTTKPEFQQTFTFDVRALPYTDQLSRLHIELWYVVGLLL